MDKTVIMLVQDQLNKEFHLFPKLKIDGDLGPKTEDALKNVPYLPLLWDIDRRAIGYIQYLCIKNGINGGSLDGHWGPQTSHGYTELRTKVSGGTWLPWRTDEGEGDTELLGTGGWPVQTQDELIAYYGSVGSNQTKVTSPYTLRIAWNLKQSTRRITCHEKVADSLSRILTNVYRQYKDRISLLGLDLFGGSLNVRKMRGGTNYSTHSWGIAIDWDPERNQLRWGRDKANFAKSDYNDWWSIWEEEGWVSLGRAKNYDFMHVQAAKVRK